MPVLDVAGIAVVPLLGGGFFKLPVGALLLLAGGYHEDIYLFL